MPPKKTKPVYFGPKLKRGRPKKQTATDKHIKKIVNQQLHVKAEDKKALPLANQVAVSTPAAIPPGSSFALQYTLVGAPNGIDSTITQGVGEGGRVGNKITPRSLTLNGFLIPLSNAGGMPVVPIPSIPLIARMVLYRAKDNLFPMNYSVGAFTYNPWSEVFQNGNTTIAPNNTYFDMMYKINRDKYTVYRERMFKVGTANGATAGNNTLSNNDFKLDNRYRLNLSKHIKKLQYNDAVAVNTSNAIHCVIFFCTYDNSALQINTNYIQTHYNVELDYEDV